MTNVTVVLLQGAVYSSQAFLGPHGRKFAVALAEETGLI